MSRPCYRFSALILVFIASLAWTLSSGGASAGTATGAPRYYTVNGISYMSGAAVMTSPGKVSAMVEAGSTNKSIPAGWVGAYAKIYSSSGALKCSSGWKYNSGSLPKNTGQVAFCDKNLTGAYYSDGATRAWDGDSYKTYGANRSPSQNS